MRPGCAPWYPAHSSSATMRFLRSGLSTTEPGALFAFRRLSLRESASTAARRALVACRAAALALGAGSCLDSR
jgi:hypothetical protein